MVSVAKLERSHFFSCPYGKSKEDYAKILAARQSTGGGSASLEDDDELIAEGADIRRRSRSYVSQRVERKAPWEPRRVEGDGHVMATCGFTRPRSFTEDNAFHQVPGTSYGRGGGVGRGLGGGLDLGVGVGLGVGSVWL